MLQPMISLLSNSLSPGRDFEVRIHGRAAILLLLKIFSLNKFVALFLGAEMTGSHYHEISQCFK